MVHHNESRKLRAQAVLGAYNIEVLMDSDKEVFNGRTGLALLRSVCLIDSGIYYNSIRELDVVLLPCAAPDYLHRDDVTAH